MKKQIPVVLFIFRRPELTQRVFSEIRKWSPSRLFIVADGPRAIVPGEEQLVGLTREIVSHVDWPCEVTRIYAEENLGLRTRLMTGLDEVFSFSDSAIILEDDCLPSNSFFDFSQSMLDQFAKVDEIGIVAGTNFAPYNSNQDFHFSNSAYIWGWASWARVWKSFRSAPQVESWTQAEISAIEDTFSSRSQARAFSRMMESAHQLNTWDISFAVWLRQQGFLNIVPKTNLIQNIGFGAEATHTKFEAFDVQVPAAELNGPYSCPEHVRADSRRERIMWRTKRTRWLTFPLFHPFTFTKSVLRYLRGA